MPRNREDRWWLADFIDRMQSEGRYTFTLAEAQAALERSPETLRAAAARLKEKRRLLGPWRGLYVIVPAEYRSTGAPPPSWYIDDLMHHHAQRYYVGLLTAAALHGAAHQQPQRFQVLTDRPTKALTAGRSHIQFFRKRALDQSQTVRLKTETGSMVVSTPETTALDLLRHLRAAGHLNNVATVLAELCESMDPQALVRAAEAATTPEVQRAGYLLELVGQDELAGALATVVEVRRTRVVPLRPDAPHAGAPLDSRWRVLVNETVEPDL